VIILELYDFREIPDLEELKRGVQWEYPPIVKEAFMAAGIRLKIVLADEPEETGYVKSVVFNFCLATSFKFSFSILAYLVDVLKSMDILVSPSPGLRRILYLGTILKCKI
jgi:hypothetical protein